jgi:hypothetical protein
MNERYLWDRTGPADPEIQRLEHALAPLRYRHRPLTVVPPAATRPVLHPWRLAAAAAVVVGAVALWRVSPVPPANTTWQVAGLHGHAQFGSRQAAVDMAVPGGQTVRTGESSTLTLRAEETGLVDIGPESTLHASSGRRLSLERGALHAYIWARPGQFVVDTPSARTIDLGCEYVLTVDNAGDGHLKVSMGWVAFSYAGRESFIPAGAQCITRRRGGPGVPYFDDAPGALQRGVAAFDQGDSSALQAILENAREADGLTLWHLLTRVPILQRGEVFDRFSQLVKLPSEVTRINALRADAHTIDLCWNALGLESAEWWRGWERRWQ